MRRSSIYSILAILALTGCQTKELDNTPQRESKPFSATIEDGFDDDETRTYLDEHGNVLWKRGDQISIFAGSTINEQYQVTDDSEGKTAASLNRVTDPGFVAGGEIENNVAFYPYTSTATIARNESDYVISDITLPAVQNYAEASFGNGAFPMAAVTSNTEDMSLKFKNVLGGLKLQLKGTARIKSITVTGNQDETLCGAAAVTVSTSGTPSINLTDATAKVVTLDCGEGVQLDAETATPFVIALPPMTMEVGFTVIVTDIEDKQMEIKTTKSQTINRSSLLKMPAVTYEGSPALTVLHAFLPDNIEKEKITSIIFHVKDNTVTDKQLFASVPVYYEIDGTTVHIYTSAKKYDIRGVTNQMFKNYYALKNLDLSNTVVSGSASFYEMFYDCFSLESIQFGDWNATPWRMEWMFCGCRKLRSLDLSFMDTHNVTNLWGVFMECWSLSSIDLSTFDTSNVTKMTQLFSYCRGLSSVDLSSFNTSNVTDMVGMFTGCETLRELDLSNFDTSKVTNMMSMFFSCES